MEARFYLGNRHIYIESVPGSWIEEASLRIQVKRKIYAVYTSIWQYGPGMLKFLWLFSCLKYLTFLHLG